MGMDVSGRNPKNKDGEYFRANCWSWRPIHAMIELADQTIHVFDEKTMIAMSYNDGAGLKDQASCDKLADELERLLGDKRRLKKACPVVTGDRIGFRVDKEFAVNSEGRFVSADEKVPLDDLHSPYATDEAHVREFIAFLRGCGGFEVW